MQLRFGVVLLAVAAAGAADLAPAERQANIDSFEFVWKTVRDKHWQTKPGGLDWQAVHDELRPKIEKAASAAEAREILSGMLARLHQTHFGIFPADVYKEFETPGAADGETGIDVRILEGKAIVTGVDADSPAAAKGVKPGWEIVRIADAEVARAVARMRDAFKDSTLFELAASRGVRSRLNGRADKPVAVEFLDGAEHRVSLNLDHAMPRGALVRLGSFPPFYFWAESKMARPEVAYVRFNAFFDPDTLIKAFATAVKNCGNCSGFVIDLRGNPGGLGALAMGVAGWFVDKNGLQLGTMLMRDTKLNFVVFPRPEPYRGPLAILVDGCSASTSEIFAGGMKDLHRGRVFGTRTAAAALPSTFETLPNGDGFQYAIANYISQGGQPLEGLGVTPDEEVKLTRRALLDGHDPVLDAALRWIDQQKRTPQ